MDRPFSRGFKYRSAYTHGIPPLVGFFAKEIADGGLPLLLCFYARPVFGKQKGPDPAFLGRKLQKAEKPDLDFLLPLVFLVPDAARTRAGGRGRLFGGLLWNKSKARVFRLSFRRSGALKCKAVFAGFLTWHG
jgi:hypothetical protein